MISVTARAASAATVPGGAAEVLVAVANLARPGAATAAQPSFTVDAPTGFAYAGATNLDRVPSFMGGLARPGSWRCRRSGNRVTCSYGGTLPPGATLAVLLRFTAPASAKPGGVAAFRVTGGGSATGRNARASLRVIAGPGYPALYAETTTTNEAKEDRPGTESVDVLNTGSVAATSVKLANLLPASVVGTWRLVSPGWSCSGAQGAPPTCESSRPVKPGAFAPQLRISFTLDPNRVQSLGLVIGGKPSVQDWDVEVTSTGGIRTFTVKSPAELAVAPPPGSQITASAVAKRGLQELLPGTETTIEAKLSNVGTGPTTGHLGLGGSIPAGTSIVSVGGTQAWKCEGATTPAPQAQAFQCASTAEVSLAPGKTTNVAIKLLVDKDAKPGKGQVELGGVADNQIPSLKPRGTSLPITILEGNVGFPALDLFRSTGKHGKLESANDGGAAPVIAGQPFVERLDVRNAGGASIPVGAHATLHQTITAGGRIKSVQSASGWNCAGTGTGTLSCTVLFGADLKPAAVLTGPTVTITAGAAEKKTVNWPAEVRLEGAGEPKAAKQDVLVSITQNVARPVPNFTNIHIPTAGGTGEFGLAVHNGGNVATEKPVQLFVHLPGGVRFEKIVEAGWACKTAATSAHCTSATTLAAGHHLPELRLFLSFAKRTGDKTVNLTAHASLGGKASQYEKATMPVEARHSLRAMIKEPDHVAFDDQPIIRAGETMKPTELVLEGDGSGGSGIGLHYAWTEQAGQPKVTWLGPRNEPDVRFLAPQVTKATKLVFKLTVDDGSASATDTVRLNVMPLPSASSGFAIRNAHPGKEKSAGPLREKRKLPTPAEKLKTTTKPKTNKTTEIVAAPTDTTTPTTTDTTPSTTTEPTTTESGLPAVFCQLVRDAISSSGGFSGSIAGASFGFEHLDVSGTGCSSSTTVSFSGTSFSIAGLKGSGLAGKISASGISITAGSLSAPDSWHAPSFTFDNGGLSVPFSGDSASLSGTLTGAGFAFVPLPSGWNGTTTLSFSGSGVSVSTSATGPKSDASPDSPAPTATISGAVSTNGTFSLDVSVIDIVQLAGTGVNLTGSVKRESADGPISASFEGSITSPITIVPGLQIKTLTVKMAPTDTGLGLSGVGEIAMSTPSGSAGVKVALTYENPKNWSLEAEGTGDADWTPLPGLTIKPSDFTGSIIAKDDKYDLTLKAALSTDWKPSSSVTISGLELTLSNQCPDTGAPCPTDASVFFDAKGSVTVALPGIGDVQTDLAGTLALPSGEFSIEAKLANPVSVGAGITIDNASVLIQRGLTQPNEDPSAETNDTGGFRVDLTGGVTLPGLGKLPTVHASFSSQGFAIAVPLGSFSLPGSSGDGSKLGSAVAGWSSYATNLNVVDPVTKAVTKIALPANTFKLTGEFTTPSWLAKTLGLSGDVKARATGIFDPDHDYYALRMELAFSNGPFLYGSSTSATNVKLKSAYFEINRQGGEFNLALGGVAGMNVAANGGLQASSIDVGIALSYAISSQTVAGSLSFTSPNGWQNAFGARDLTLYQLSIAFAFNIPTLTPTIGFGATATLPGDIRSQLGLLNSAKTTLVANFSITNPCIALMVEDPTNMGKTVLSIGNGAVTSTQFDLEIAPTGCTVGVYKYAPGISINFAGNIAGVSVAIAARIGLSPFGFDGSADIGSFAVGGLTVKQTHIAVSLTTSKVSVQFSGGVEAFGTNVDIAGSFVKKGSSFVSDFKGSLDKLTIGDAISAQGLQVQIHTETGGTNVLQFAAKGKIALFGSTVDAAFALSLQNGQLNQAIADVNANINVGGLGLVGIFHVNYSKTSPLAIDAKVSATYNGYNLANATVTVRPGYLVVTTDFTIGSVFTAHLAGAAYYGNPNGATIALPTGQTVAAKTGDFYISAKDVALNLAGFKSTGSIWLGKAGSLAQAYVNGSVQIVGTGGTNSVNYSGSIDGNGNFSFAGSAALDLAGFKPQMAVSIVKQGTNLAVSGSASIQVLSSSVAVKGDFAYDNGQFHYRLAGTATIQAGSYQLAGANVSLSNFPQDAGLKAAVTLRLGSTLTANGTLNIGSNGSFDLNVNSSLNLRLFSVNANVRFYAGPQQVCTPVITWQVVNFGFFKLNMPIVSNQCGTVNAAPTLDASATVGTSGFSFGVNVRISGDGSFSASARTPVSGETTASTGTVSLVVVRGYAYFSYHMQLGISSSSPYVSVNGAGSAGIKYQHWEVSGWPWDWGWSGWKDGPSVSASISTNPFKICGYVSLFGYNVGGCLP
jgi:hypothetical protein